MTQNQSDASQMAVLVQQLLPARYAFVSHTRNPISGAQTSSAKSACLVSVILSCWLLHAP